jgi:polysaccharide pyruvyl transferase CsaB
MSVNSPPEQSTAVEEFAASLNGARGVLIAGGYGCGNAGDEAILSVLLGEPALATREVTVVSSDPRDTARVHGVHAVAARPAPLLGAIGACDTLVVGGGGIFSAYMGRRSMLLPFITLAARAATKRVLFRALGVYRSTPPAVGRLLAVSMDRAAFASVRDAPSAAALRRFGMKRSPMLEPDPALRLQPAAHTCDIPLHAVGFALRRVRNEAQQPRLDAVYAEAIAAVEDSGRVPILIPFCSHPTQAVEQDEAYLAELRSRSGARSCLLLDRLPPADLLSVVASLDALVAMRFHAILFGHIAGTPTLAVPYDDKCSAFAAERAIPTIGMSALTRDVLLSGLAELNHVKVAA